jgi:hypothetical protein
MTDTFVDAREIFEKVKRQEAAKQQAEPDVWPTMNEAAYHGFAGDVVRTIEPHTEADSVAILIQFLTCAGSIIGRAPYHKIEGNHHHANLFSVLVGDSSKARKGTAWGRVCEIAKIADDVWYRERIKGGLSSGEGFIGEVRDAATKWNTKEKVLETIDPGVIDKRLMVVEPEFAMVLAVAERQGNTLTSHIRQAWDGGILSTMTRSSPLRATGAHVSIIGHVTIDELRARLSAPTQQTVLQIGFCSCWSNGPRFCRLVETHLMTR